MITGYQRYRRGPDQIELLCVSCAEHRCLHPNGACSDWLTLTAADGVDAFCDDCGAPLGPVVTDREGP